MRHEGTLTLTESLDLGDEPLIVSGDLLSDGGTWSVRAGDVTVFGKVDLGEGALTVRRQLRVSEGVIAGNILVHGDFVFVGGAIDAAELIAPDATVRVGAEVQVPGRIAAGDLIAGSDVVAGDIDTSGIVVCRYRTAPHGTRPRTYAADMVYVVRHYRGGFYTRSRANWDQLVRKEPVRFHNVTDDAWWEAQERAEREDEEDRLAAERAAYGEQ
jgi:hypothetical protein